MLPIQQGLTVTNYNKRGTNPEWIVLHYTANNGDTAANNISYFRTEYRGASANYFVDENSIWQCVADTNTAWHVGNDTYKNGARNTNSIGIEMCSYRRAGTQPSDLSAYYIADKTVQNAIELTRYLMDKYYIPIDRVCRHYDVTGKYCPAPMVYNNGNTTWSQFLAKVKEMEDSLLSKEYELLVKKMDEQHNAVLGTMADMRKEYTPVIYDYVSQCPEWARMEIERLVERGFIVGADEKKDRLLDGKKDVYVRFTFDMCRLAVMMERLTKAAENAIRD